MGSLARPRARPRATATVGEQDGRSRTSSASGSLPAPPLEAALAGGAGVGAPLPVPGGTAVALWPSRAPSLQGPGDAPPPACLLAAVALGARHLTFLEMTGPRGPGGQGLGGASLLLPFTETPCSVERPGGAGAPSACQLARLHERAHGIALSLLSLRTQPRSTASRPGPCSLAFSFLGKALGCSPGRPQASTLYSSAGNPGRPWDCVSPPLATSLPRPPEPPAGGLPGLRPSPWDRQPPSSEGATLSQYSSFPFL